MKEIEDLILSCSGIWLEANSNNFSAVPGEDISLSIQAIARNPVNAVLKSVSFFNGIGYNDNGVSSPTQTNWVSALTGVLDSLENSGYSYYLTTDDQIVIYLTNCEYQPGTLNLKINVGINYIYKIFLYQNFH